MAKQTEYDVYIVGARVRQLRDRVGFTQGQLATYSGTSQATISNIERGFQNTVSSAILLRLAKKLRSNVSYLVGETDDNRPPDGQLTIDDLLADEEELVRLYRGLGDNIILKQMVLHAAKGAAEIAKSAAR